MAGKPTVEGFHRLAGLQQPRRSAADPRSRRARRRGPARRLSPPLRRGDLADRIRRGALEFADRDFKRGGCHRCRGPGQRRLEFARLIGRAVADQPLPHRQQRSAADLARPHAENCPRPETVPADGTTAAPDRRCAAASARRFRARSCAIAPARSWQPRRLRPARWRARTPASATPATAAEAARDNPSAARSMSGSMRRYARLCCADGKCASTGHHKSPGVKKSFRNYDDQMRRSDRTVHTPATPVPPATRRSGRCRATGCHHRARRGRPRSTARAPSPAWIRRAAGRAAKLVCARPPRAPARHRRQ